MEPKRIYAVDQQAEDDSLDVKETYNGLVNSEKALREQKIGHEGNVRRMRTKAGKGTVQMKLVMEEENVESSEEISSPKLDACVSVTKEISSSLKMNLDACISVTRGDAIKE